MSAQPSITFPYREFKVFPFPSSKRSIKIYRPIIPLTIFYRQKFVQFAALIDSGADCNIFPSDVANYLGIELTKGRRRNITGISGGKIKGYEHPVNLKVGSCKFSSKIAFSNQFPKNALAVLGNKGFFDKFSVRFVYSKGLIELSKLSRRKRLFLPN